jgi:hypothetical protein
MKILNPSILKRNIFSFLIIIILSQSAAGQILPNRYIDQVFSTFVETQNVQFSTQVPQPKPGGGFYEFITGLPLNAQEDNFDLVDLRMDIFQPQGDTMELRPLIIIAFGGGFLDNDRFDPFIRLLAQNLALRGFVTASIDYRLGMNIFDEELSKRAVYRGLQDGRSAVRYFKNDASTLNTYRIDTNLIFMGGHSSGGFIAVHNAFLNIESERPISTFDYPMPIPQYPDLGCFDCVGDNQGFKGTAKAIFNLAGAIGDTLYMEDENDPPIISFHSTDDDTVPYQTGQPFSYLAPLVFGFDLPEVHGSSPIHTRADNKGINNTFNSYTSRGHDIHHNGISLYPDIVPGIANFFFNECLKPEDAVIDGNSIFCNSDNIQVYSVDPDNYKYYDWEVIGGVITDGDQLSNEIIIDWDPLAPIKNINLTPYTIYGARGNTVSFNVNSTVGEIIQWTTGNGEWSNINNWNMVRIPLTCDQVEITTIIPLTIDTHNTQSINIKSLTFDGPVSLNIHTSTTFNISGN